ncbi:EAL domain-containing protein [Novosphingobium tardum]|uniref:EAL domain-containing protein n=1 Tax=Novosphingobium tardum TaxID=1538021 RepID=A0ABV8RR39_9SPHN
MASTAQIIAGADHDALTGLASAAAARRLLDAWAEATASDDTPVFAMLIGLQRLQGINHAYGRPVGDVALAEVARRIRQFASQELDGHWLAARIGGGDFLLATRSPCSRAKWQWLAHALADIIARPLGTAGATLRLAPRIALLHAVEPQASERLLDSLSQALAAARSQPGRRLQWADGRQSTRGRSAAAMEADLLRAIDANEISVLFQPQFAAGSGLLVGAEALARWDHPVLGRLGAPTLFAVTERADHTVQLSRHIASRALALAGQWPAERGLRLSLNLAAADLAADSFVKSISDAIERGGMAPTRLTLEVTEQALLVDLECAADAFSELSRAGVRIALDDFGTGFSNFWYLKNLPLDYLKLDHSLTDDVLVAPRDRAILRAIVGMARALDLEVVAEGVESEEQLAMLAAEGCDYFQGFVRAGPLSHDDFLRFASTN